MHCDYDSLWISIEIDWILICSCDAVHSWNEDGLPWAQEASRPCWSHRLLEGIYCLVIPINGVGTRSCLLSLSYQIFFWQIKSPNICFWVFFYNALSSSNTFWVSFCLLSSKCTLESFSEAHSYKCIYLELEAFFFLSTNILQCVDNKNSNYINYEQWCWSKINIRIRSRSLSFIYLELFSFQHM